MSEIVGLLLAAGNSSRFGHPKLLHPLADGVPVGIASAQNLQQVLPRIMVVIRPEDELLKRAYLDLGLTVIENPVANQGMGTSISAGIKASFDASGWIIALADMPWVRPETIKLLVKNLLKGASMVAPVHLGRRGNPVGFSSQWRESLQTLQGDTGARNLLVKHSRQLVLHETDDTGILKDVDYPADIEIISL